ncbi:holin family protein [Paenibacillus sp. HJGM_3]
MQVFTAATANNGKEAAFAGFFSSIALFATNWLGGWDVALKVLLYLMAADYVTGVLGAIRTKTVNSDVMFWGGIRKVTLLFVIGLATLLDEWVGNGVPVFRTAAVYFYAGREGLSVAENLGTLGVPLPGLIRDYLQQLNKKGESKQ